MKTVTIDRSCISAVELMEIIKDNNLIFTSVEIEMESWEVRSGRGDWDEFRFHISGVEDK